MISLRRTSTPECAATMRRSIPDAHLSTLANILSTCCSQRRSGAQAGRERASSGGQASLEVVDGDVVPDGYWERVPGRYARRNLLSAHREPVLDQGNVDGEFSRAWLLELVLPALAVVVAVGHPCGMIGVI